MRRALIVIVVVFGIGCSTGARPVDDAGLPYYDSPEFTPKWTPVSHHIGDFQLITQQNRPVSGRDLAGRIHVASFIFTACPNICPLLVQQLKRVQEASDVLLVSYSVTPATDTPTRLAQFGAERGIDAGRWLLVTGDAAQIATLARESYFAEDVRLDRSGPDAAAQVLHTEKLLLVDEEGRLRGVYNGTVPFDINRLIEDVRTLQGTGAPGV